MESEYTPTSHISQGYREGRNAVVLTTNFQWPPYCSTVGTWYGVGQVEYLDPFGQPTGEQHTVHLLDTKPKKGEVVHVPDVDNIYYGWVNSCGAWPVGFRGWGVSPIAN